MQPHQQRVVDEKKELDNKIDKLHQFFSTDIYYELDEAEQGRLVEQIAAMRQYSMILGQRIRNFK